jgi:hypothetical protein
MLHQFIGAEDFKTGIQNYMQVNSQFSTQVLVHLYLLMIRSFFMSSVTSFLRQLLGQVTQVSIPKQIQELCVTEMEMDFNLSNFLSLLLL